MSKALNAVVAAAAGFAAGILLAPKSGKETREDIKAKALETKERAEVKAEEAKEVLKESAARAEAEARDTRYVVGDGVNVLHHLIHPDHYKCYGHKQCDNNNRQHYNCDRQQYDECFHAGTLLPFLGVIAPFSILLRLVIALL